jgi:tetratricopeptide (TPR) repeat protein
VTDPELEMLRELLEEDPSADVFLDVGRELCRREKWADAATVLSAGLEQNAELREGWELLARAGVASGRAAIALAALERVSPTPEKHPDLVKLEVQALCAVGQLERAALLAESLVLLHPAMGPVETLLAGSVVAAPPPEVEPPLVLSVDPVLTEDRAEAYTRAGRPDRAIRVLRRLLFYNPRSKRIRDRLTALLGTPHEHVHDDLSEELPDPSRFPPPEIAMPRLYAGDAPTPSPAVQDASTPVNDLTRAADEETSDVRAGGTPRKRRSLLRR